MLVEILCEAAFAHLGYLVCKKWKERGVGREYFDYVESRKEVKE